MAAADTVSTIPPISASKSRVSDLVPAVYLEHDRGIARGQGLDGGHGAAQRPDQGAADGPAEAETEKQAGCRHDAQQDDGALFIRCGLLRRRVGEAADLGQQRLRLVLEVLLFALQQQDVFGEVAVHAARRLSEQLHGVRLESRMVCRDEFQLRRDLLKLGALCVAMCDFRCAADQRLSGRNLRFRVFTEGRELRQRLLVVGGRRGIVLPYQGQTQAALQADALLQLCDGDVGQVARERDVGLGDIDDLGTDAFQFPQSDTGVDCDQQQQHADQTQDLAAEFEIAEPGKEHPAHDAMSSIQ